MKLLKFYADWCGPCKMQSKIIESAGDKITMPIENVNSDDNVMMGITYNIKSLPTLVVVDDQYNEIKRHVGLMPEKELVEWLAQ